MIRLISRHFFYFSFVFLYLIGIGNIYASDTKEIQRSTQLKKVVKEFYHNARGTSPHYGSLFDSIDNISTKYGLIVEQKDHQLVEMFNQNLKHFWKYIEQIQKDTHLFLEEDSKQDVGFSNRQEDHCLIMFLLMFYLLRSGAVTQIGDNLYSYEKEKIHSEFQFFSIFDVISQKKEFGDLFLYFLVNGNILMFFEHASNGNMTSYINKMKEDTQELISWSESADLQVKIPLLYDMVISQFLSPLKKLLTIDTMSVDQYDELFNKNLFLTFIKSFLSDNLSLTTSINLKSLITKTIKASSASHDFFEKLKIIDIEKCRNKYHFSLLKETMTNFRLVYLTLPTKKNQKKFKKNQKEIIKEIHKNLKKYFPPSSLETIAQRILDVKFYPHSEITTSNFSDSLHDNSFDLKISFDNYCASKDRVFSFASFFIMDFFMDTISQQSIDSDNEFAIIFDLAKILGYTDLDGLLEYDQSFKESSSCLHAGISVGWQSVKFPQIFQSILVHEIGHKIWTELTKLEQKGDIQVVAYMSALKSNLKKMHPNIQNPSSYATEDFCDAISAKIFPASPNLGILLDPLSQFDSSYNNNPFENCNPNDPHSSQIFRIFHFHYLAHNKKLPKRSKKFLQTYYPEQIFLDVLEMSRIQLQKKRLTKSSFP